MGSRVRDTTPPCTASRVLRSASRERATRLEPSSRTRYPRFFFKREARSGLKTGVMVASSARAVPATAAVASSASSRAHSRRAGACLYRAAAPGARRAAAAECAAAGRGKTARGAEPRRAHFG